MNRHVNNPYLWGQLALLAVLAVFLSTYFQSAGIASDADFASVESKVLERVDGSLYPKQDTQKLRRYLGIDPSLTENVSFFRLDDAMSANELVLMEFTDSSRDALESAIESRRSAQQQIYEGYAPEQAQLMKDALIDFEDNYALYYVGNDPQSMQSAFRQALKGN